MRIEDLVQKKSNRAVAICLSFNFHCRFVPGCKKTEAGLASSTQASM